MKWLIIPFLFILAFACSKDETKPGPSPDEALIGKWVLYKVCGDYGTGGCIDVSNELMHVFEFRQYSVYIDYEPGSDSVIYLMRNFEITNIDEHPGDNYIEYMIKYSDIIYPALQSAEDSLEYGGIIRGFTKYFSVDYSLADGKYSYTSNNFTTYYRKIE